MSWQLIVALRLFTAYVVAQPLVKLLSKTSMPQKFLLQFLFCLVIVSVSQFFIGSSGSNGLLGIVAMGFASSTAAYCQWRAISYSLSKYALFSTLDDIIPIVLTACILGDHQYFNVWVVSGSVLTFAAFLLFAVGDYRKARVHKDDVSTSATTRASRTPLAFYGYVLWLTIVWGVVRFLLRYFALNDVPKMPFLGAWYTGAAFGALAIILVTGGVKTEDKPLTSRDIRLVFVLAVAIVVSFLFEYWGVILAPLLKTQPIYLLGEMILPAVIGLIFFGERKHLGRLGWWCFAIGALGGVLLFLS